MLIGILFPPTHDNPISIALGTLFLMTMTVLFLVVMFMLQLSLMLEVISMIGLTLIIVCLSVYALGQYERIEE